MSYCGTAICTAMALALVCAPVAGGPQAGFRVAIVDRFYPPMEGFTSDDDRRLTGWLYGQLDLDRDQIREPYFHGDLVRLVAASPGLEFFEFPLPGRRHPLEEILENLRKIRTRQSQQPMDALVLSWESSSLVSAFDDRLDTARADHYKQIVRHWGESDPVWRATVQIIDELEQLVAQGVRVYTIAGNGGPRMINTFSFAEGVTTVGAVEQQLDHYVADNPFVDRHERAAYHIERVDDAAGVPLGYDIDGDGCVDIPVSRLSAGFLTGDRLPRSSYRPLMGSSFAAPMALRRDLEQIAGLRAVCNQDEAPVSGVGLRH